MLLDHQKIIIRPIFTEKMSRLEDERKYCFQVQLGANKLCWAIAAKLAPLIQIKSTFPAS